MKTIGILYATREGQTRRIAGHVSQKLKALGHDIEQVDVAHPDGIRLEAYDGAFLASSVHMWRHAPEMTRFVKRHRLQLARIPTAFLSISLCEAGAEDPDTEPHQQVQNRLDAHWLMDRFFAATHWHPNIAEPVAGALRYTQYPPLRKFIMQQIARVSGSTTDTSQDHEFTDWARLDDAVDRFAKLLEGVPVRPVAEVAEVA
jgi:menaquinone-dependent protoporphyrinogen oxidase